MVATLNVNGAIFTSTDGKNYFPAGAPRRQPASERRRSGPIFEQVAAAPGRVDRAAGILYGCRVLGGRSVNGRRYTPEAMKRGVKLYEGVKVFAGHDYSEGGRNRKPGDCIGWLEAATARGDSIYADLHLLDPDDPTCRKLLAAAEKRPSLLGFSHHAEGTGRFSKGEQLIEDIEKVHSVDLVLKPATTGGLFEQAEEPDTGKAKHWHILNAAGEYLTADAGWSANQADAELFDSDAAIARADELDEDGLKIKSASAPAGEARRATGPRFGREAGVARRDAGLGRLRESVGFDAAARALRGRAPQRLTPAFSQARLLLRRKPTVELIESAGGSAMSLPRQPVRSFPTDPDAVRRLVSTDRHEQFVRRQ